MAKVADLEALVTQVAARDKTAFEQLYALTSAKLFGICLRVLASRPKAQAVLWAAFLQIWDEAGSREATGLSAMTWIIHVTHQKAIERLRIDLAQAVETVRPNESEAEKEWPEDLVLKPSEYGHLIKCMGALPWERSALFRLAYVEGETYSDLASHFDLPAETMRTWVRQDLGILAECLSR